MNRASELCGFQLRGVIDKMIGDSTDQANLQIQQAADGMISGRLSEWPHLKSALRKRGIFLPDNAAAPEIKRVCRKLVKMG